jgi:hypothetical protein
MSIGATVTEDATQTIQRLALDLKLDIAVVLKRLGRLEAVSFARSTQPYTKGGDKEGLRANYAESLAQGKGAVDRDIRRMFKTGGSVYAEIRATGDEPLASAFYIQYQANKLKGKKGAEALMQKSTTKFKTLTIERKINADLHKQSRDGRGRVARNRLPKQVLAGDKSLEIYIAKKQQMVGLAKSGWASAAREMGGAKDIPSWAKRWKNTGSATDKTGNGNMQSVIIESKVKYASQALPAGEEAQALRIAADRLRKSLEEAKEKRIAKANAKANIKT